MNLPGDVKLILMDGASLTVKRITSSDEATLSVYGQSAGTGKLTVDNTILSDPNYSAMTVNGLTVHGGEIEVKAARSNVNYLVGGVLSSGPVTVYNGKVTATSDNGCGIRITYNHLIVYDGEVNITSKGDAILLYNDNNLTHTDLEIKGGSVTAKSTVGSGVHIKRTDQLSFRRKRAALYPLYLKGNAVPSPCMHLSFFIPDRLHKKIRMCRYSLAYRICKSVKVNAFIKLIKAGYIVDGCIGISLTLDIDTRLRHRKRIFIP